MISNRIWRVMIVANCAVMAIAVQDPPPATSRITAALSSMNPIVGMSKISITGTASAGATVTDTSVFPDGSTHTFSVTANRAGAYTDGPFVLHQLGVYHDVLRDKTTGASTSISYSGVGDFSVAVDANNQTIAKGQATSYEVTFSSSSGFGGVVIPAVRNWQRIRGVSAWWLNPAVSVPSGGTASGTLMVQCLASTPAGTYRIEILGSNGSKVRRTASPVSLTISARPSPITAQFIPDNPIVGMTKVSITGTATPGAMVSDVSKFPDGTIHHFQVKASDQSISSPLSTKTVTKGGYTDGPFVLQQLGTYHDVLRDEITHASTTVSYGGQGDFELAVNNYNQTVKKGDAAILTVTFTSLRGFTGTVVPVLGLPKALGSVATWSPRSITVRSNGSIIATVAIPIASSTLAGTYNIELVGRNGSVTRALPSAIKLTVN